MSSSSKNRIISGIVIAAAVILLGTALFIDLGKGFPSGARTRTIMLYGIGSNLESAHGNLSFNIGQMLDADITPDVKVVIMTGGSYRWFLPEDRTIDKDGNPVQGDPDTKQIWEIRKDATGANKLVLIENMESLNDNYMTDGICLQTFLTYCKDNYSSDLYDLILWDHGYGPFGYGNDFYYPLIGVEYDEVPMPLEQIAEAIDNADFGGSLEMIDFDACLMGNVEVLNALSDRADYMVVSAESVPEFGQYYTNWISKVSNNPRMNGYEIGKMIVDDTIWFYSDESSKGYGRPCTFAVIDTAKYNEKMLKPVLEYTSRLASDAFTGNESNTYYNKLLAANTAHKYSWEGISDLLDLATKLSSYEAAYSENVSSLSKVLSDSSVMYFAHTPSISDSCGISLFFPGSDPRNTKRYVLAMEDLKSYIAKCGGEDSATKTAILDNQIRTATGYGLVQNTGYAVSEFVDNNGTGITYNDLTEIWNTKEKPTIKKIEYAYEHGSVPDESGLSTPWDKGISVLIDRAGSFITGMTAEDWVVSLSSNMENEIRQGTDCTLPSNGLSSDITIQSEREVLDVTTNKTHTEPYNAVIGNLYGQDESEVKPFDGCWYALTDAAGHNYLTSLITTAANPSSGTATVIIKKQELSYDGTPYDLDIQGAITVVIENGSARITGIYAVEAGEYKTITPEEASAMTIYTGYLTRGYGSNRLSPDSVLTLDTSAENFGLSITSGMRLEDMDDVDAARAGTAQIEYSLTNIYGYVRKVG